MEAWFVFAIVVSIYGLLAWLLYRQHKYRVAQVSAIAHEIRTRYPKIVVFTYTNGHSEKLRVESEEHLNELRKERGLPIEESS